jgi:hypothetical protein
MVVVTVVVGIGAVVTTPVIPQQLQADEKAAPPSQGEA